MYLTKFTNITLFGEKNVKAVYKRASGYQRATSFSFFSRLSELVTFAECTFEVDELSAHFTYRPLRHVTPDDL